MCGSSHLHPPPPFNQESSPPPPQAYALCQVHAWGADVNVDAALWAPLYASTAVSLVYAGAVAMSASWREVWGGANGLLMAAMSVVAVAYDNLVYRWVL
ncbi:hypothetical protein FOA52_009204 [Chlamydomonas sp. UWO 241]|nr:hypothetical protein FOA52_009204 [Chlamydomonas sp. UWO 241]